MLGRGGRAVAPSLPVERFDLRSFAPAERREAWREVLASTHLPWNTPLSAIGCEGASAWVQRVRLGSLTFFARARARAGRILRPISSVPVTRSARSPFPSHGRSAGDRLGDGRHTDGRDPAVRAPQLAHVRPDRGAGSGVDEQCVPDVPHRAPPTCALISIVVVRFACANACERPCHRRGTRRLCIRRGGAALAGRADNPRQER